MANYLLLYKHPERDHLCWAVCQPKDMGLSDADAIQRVASTIDVVTGTPHTPYRLVDPSEVVEFDPRYRECLEDTGTEIVINRRKARAVDAAS